MPLRLLYLMSLFLSNLRVGLLHFPVIILFHFLVCLPWWFTFCSFWYFFFLYARLFMFRIWSIYTFPYAVLYQSLFKYIHTIHASIHIYIHSRVHLCVCMWVYQQFAGLIISRLLSFPSFFFFFSLWTWLRCPCSPRPWTLCRAALSLGAAATPPRQVADSKGILLW